MQFNMFYSFVLALLFVFHVVLFFCCVSCSFFHVVLFVCSLPPTNAYINAIGRTHSHAPCGDDQCTFDARAGRIRANAVISASLDGTVRAYDLSRYKNFRTMTSPKPTQVRVRLCVCASVRECIFMFS